MEGASKAAAVAENALFAGIGTHVGRSQPENQSPHCGLPATLNHVNRAQIDNCMDCDNIEGLVKTRYARNIEKWRPVRS